MINYAFRGEMTGPNVALTAAGIWLTFGVNTAEMG